MATITKLVHATRVFLALTGFALSPTIQAVSPTPDGGYPNFNTAEGHNALFNLTTGQWNTALGAFTLWKNTDGSFNTAVGTAALLLNIGNQGTGSGLGNTAVGAAALLLNTTGSFNTAAGISALFSNTVGMDNTATGSTALAVNASGNFNTADGSHALANNTVGGNNTANGYAVLLNNLNGGGNTASGYEALYNNSSGDNNTAIGNDALFSNLSGSFNTALGISAGANVTTASNVICIGSAGADVDSTTWIGNVYGVITQNGTTAPVIVSADGQLGTVASSERFKKDITSMDKASDAILSLRPVTFHYKTDITDTPQFGLIAEEVAKVNPALVLPDKEGKPYTVRYEAVNAMLLNEFLKDHKKVEEQQATIAQLKSNAAKQEATISELKKDMGVVTAQLKEQGAQIQKVSAQLEVGRLAPRVVNNDP